MHRRGLLHRLFYDAANFIDKRIHRTLLMAAETLPNSTHLSLTSIGRSLCSCTTVKHNIKRLDRLFGNKILHSKTQVYYRTIANYILKDHLRPKIIIDWSGLTRCGEYHLLSANIAVGGRALPILTKAYRECEYTKQKTHKEFLKSLKALLPDNCFPIIITDAGFRNSWFKLIRHFRWDFVGRVRHLTRYKTEKEGLWVPVKSLYATATTTPHYVLSGTLAKTNPLPCHFYLYQDKKKNRTKKNLRGKKVMCSVSKKHAKAASEPWLLVTSLEPEIISAKEIIEIYRLRMQIEEYFRDIKNTKNGFGLRHCRSYDKNRLNVALLIAAMAALSLWIVGLIVKTKGLHFSFQSNTMRKRRVLSIFTIGWQALRQGLSTFKKKEIDLAIKELSLCAVI